MLHLHISGMMNESTDVHIHVTFNIALLCPNDISAVADLLEWVMCEQCISRANYTEECNHKPAISWGYCWTDSIKQEIRLPYQKLEELNQLIVAWTGR